MTLEMNGKVALITGGAGGIGKAFGEALLERGAKVCLADLNETLGKRTELELEKRFGSANVFFHECDVTAEEKLEGMFQETIRRYGHIDILCNNAGVANEHNWKLMMDINLTAVISGTLLAFKYMGKTAGRSHAIVVNTASDAGVRPCRFLPMYGASKHGVVGFSRSIGDSSQKLYHVRVNCICPTVTDTSIVKDAHECALDSENLEENTESILQQMGGIMQPSDVADGLIELLHKDDVSGEVLLVTPKGRKILQFLMSIDELLNMSCRT